MTMSTVESGTSGRPSRALTGNRPVRVVVTALAAAVLAIVGISSPASAATKLSQSSAQSYFNADGVTWSSSGGCTTRSNPSCTSFEQINLDTVKGAITFKRISGCAVNITGGTEVGHAAGTYSHYNGYKVDIRKTTCVTNYITTKFTFAGTRGDGAALYKSASGNIYANESSHWDVLYYSCGCSW